MAENEKPESITDSAIDPEKKVAPKKKIKKRSPWKPASVLHVPKEYLDPNFTYRWITRSKPGNMEKKSFEGWEIDKELMKKLQRDGILPISTLDDGKQLDKNIYSMRDMVLARLPIAMKKEREDYYRDKAHGAQEDAQEKYRAQIAGIDPEGRARGYGKIKYGRNIIHRD